MKLIMENNWVLVTQTGMIVAENTEHTDSHGEIAVITGGRPPHKPSSSGRVWANGREFFPSVFNLEWKEVNVK